MLFTDENFLYIETTDTDYSSHIINFLSSLKQNNHQRLGLDIVYNLKPNIINLPHVKIVEKQSKWKEFAQSKNIEKKKKLFFIRDSDDNKVHRYGALSKKNMEIRSGIYKDGSSYSKMRREKEKRVKRNMGNKKRNEERYGKKTQ